jgi:HNH endonuclease
MSALTQLRKRLFDAYSAQLTEMSSAFAGMPHCLDQFACPFCLELFGRDGLNPPERISVEHCIPKKLGGTLATSTLTCTRCNNRMGSAVESHLKSRLENEAILDGKSKNSLRAWVTVGQAGKVRASMTFKGDLKEIGIHIDDKRSPKGHSLEATQALKAAIDNPAGTGIQLSLALPGNIRRSDIALLRIGYLMMFRQFGYGYILHRNLDKVREQLMNPWESILPAVDSAQLSQAPPKCNVVAVVREPTDFQGFVAVVKLVASERTVYRVITMPGLGADGDRVYERIGQASRAGLTIHTQSSVLNYRPEYVADPKALLLPFELWKELCGPPL